VSMRLLAGNTQSPVCSGLLHPAGKCRQGLLWAKAVDGWQLVGVQLAQPLLHLWVAVNG